MFCAAGILHVVHKEKVFRPNLTGGGGLRGPFYIFHGKSPPPSLGVTPPQTLGHYSQMPLL